LSAGFIPDTSPPEQRIAMFPISILRPGDAAVHFSYFTPQKRAPGTLRARDIITAGTEDSNVSHYALHNDFYEL
jgi:hypothetical protein